MSVYESIRSPSPGNPSINFVVAQAHISHAAPAGNLTEEIYIQTHIRRTKRSTALDDATCPVHDIVSQPNKRDLFMPLVPEMALALVPTLPLSPRLRRISLSLIQHIIKNRSLLLSMTAVMAIGPELFFVCMAARRAIALLDSFLELGPMVVTFEVVFALAVVLFATAGRVA